MSQKAARYTDRLLNQGHIHGTSNGTQPGNPGYVNAADAPRDRNINRTYKVGNAFFTEQLGPTLVHEGRHVQQLAHIQPDCSENCSQTLIYKLRNGTKLEDEANRYEKANYNAPKP